MSSTSSFPPTAAAAASRDEEDEEDDDDDNNSCGSGNDNEVCGGGGGGGKREEEADKEEEEEEIPPERRQRQHRDAQRGDDDEKLPALQERRKHPRKRPRLDSSSSPRPPSRPLVLPSATAPLSSVLREEAGGEATEKEENGGGGGGGDAAVSPVAAAAAAAAACEEGDDASFYSCIAANDCCDDDGDNDDNASGSLATCFAPDVDRGERWRRRAPSSSLQQQQQQQVRKPLAPSLHEYMQPGATSRYGPHSCWYRYPDALLSASAVASAAAVAAAAAAAAAVAADDGAGANGNRGENSNARRLRFRRLVGRRSVLERIGDIPAAEPPLHYHAGLHSYSTKVNAAAAGTGTVGTGTAATTTDQKDSTSSPPNPDRHGPDNESAEAPPPPASAASFFGRKWDPALVACIREGATEAALALLGHGAPVDAANARGATPLILASQNGDLAVVRELLRRGADLHRASMCGATAVLQASHFGHLQVLKELVRDFGPALVEIGNSRATTPLMRACQEGHEEVVDFLLRHGAQSNRTNQAQMTALMLAAQRGHAGICRNLVQHGADVDSKTDQNSTALLLACKRGNVDVVRVLVTAGCDIWIKDNRGRNARTFARRGGDKAIVALIDSTVQVDLMRRQAARERSFEMIRIWHLLQQERASIPTTATGEQLSRVSIHEIDDYIGEFPLQWTQALLRTMKLPAPLVETIGKFLPLPLLWPRRLGMLTKWSVVDPVESVIGALDLMDEVLSEGGLLEASDEVNVPAPSPLSSSPFVGARPRREFNSWCDWKSYVLMNGRVEAETSATPSVGGNRRLDVTTAVVLGPSNPDAPTFVELRRQVGFFSMVATSPALAQKLSAAPYNMPPVVVQKLVVTSDLASLTRRMICSTRGGGDIGNGLAGTARPVVSFEPPLAMDLIMMASRLCSWYWREREASSSHRSYQV